MNGKSTVSKNKAAYLRAFIPLVAGSLLLTLLGAGALFLNLNAGSKSHHSSDTHFTNFVYWTAVWTNNSLTQTNEALEGITNSASRSQENSGQDQLTKELAARFFWGISAVLFVFLCFCIGSVSLRVFIYRSGHRKYCILWCVTVVVVFVLVFCFTVRPDSQSALSGGAAAGELLKLIEGTPFPISPHTLSLSPRPVEHVWVMESMLTASAASALIAVTLAACRLVYSLCRIKLFRIRAAREFEKLASDALDLLQLTSTTLVCGVFEVFFLYSTAGYHVPTLIKSDVLYFARTIAIATGFVYSGLLATIFVPLAIEQRSAGRWILKKQPKLNEKTRERIEGFAQNDLAALPVIKAGLVILSPLIASVLTKILGTITGDF